MKPRSWLPWAVLVAGLAAIGLVAGRPGSGGPPLSPRSNGPTGTRALVEAVRSLGGDIRSQREPPGPTDSVALVLLDDMDDATRDALGAWVDAGGRLVVADPGSPLNPAPPVALAQGGTSSSELLRGCDLAALKPVQQVDVPGALLLEVPDQATGCFPGGLRSWLVVARRGQGTVVSLGGAGAFTNAHLGRADNALLAVGLLAPGPGERAVVVEPSAPGGGRKGLGELVSPGVKLGLVQIALAFGVYALFRARRLGAPVVERQPVQLAGSGLVTAVGQLMHRGRRRAWAASVLREDLRRVARTRLGVPAGTSPEVLAEVLAERSGRSDPARRQALEEALTGAPPSDEADLLVLARTLDEVRREVSGHGG